MALRIYKASPCGGEPSVFDQHILIETPLPENPPGAVEDRMKAWLLLYRTQAERLASALITSLPQATMHQLLLVLLEEYACVYKGPTTDAGPLVRIHPERNSTTRKGT